MTVGVIISMGDNRGTCIIPKALWDMGLCGL